MSTDVETLERYDRLAAVQSARAILREAFDLELLVLGRRGPVAHARGGVMASSSEVCRAVLFSKAGFDACDAFYREVGASGGTGPGTSPCHLGLAAVWEPALLEGEVLAHVVASGFGATALEGCTPPDPAKLAEGLRRLNPNLADPVTPTRTLPVVRGDRVEIVRAILRTAALRIAAFEEDARRRAAVADGGLPGLWGIVGAAPQLREVFDQMRRLAESDATVLIQGESGTGKELVARALVEHGPRAGRPFVAQSCGSTTDELLESTLFGHVRGAFSGAHRPSPGLFGAAEGGTLFLDEVGETSPAMQVKLLRVLQDGSYMPVGSTSPRKGNVRVIAATHRDLHAMVADGRFRQDLFYRLHILPLELPPLRERPGDVRLLVSHFLAELDDQPRRVSEAAWACLGRHTWPGNVRELRAEVARWAVHVPDAVEIGPEHLSPPIREAGGYLGNLGGEAAAAAAAGSGTLAAAVEGLERAIITRGLERTSGNRTQLARELGISRTTLGDRLKKFGLDPD